MLWAFWAPDAMDAACEDDRRALKLAYRAKTLERQADQFVSGAVGERVLRREFDADLLMKSLDAICDVGSQSAAYLLGEFFHHYDRLDYVPPWEAKIFGLLLDMPDAATDDIRDSFRRRYSTYSCLAAYCPRTNLFGRHRKSPIEWLAQQIRL